MARSQDPWANGQGEPRRRNTRPLVAVVSLLTSLLRRYGGYMRNISKTLKLAVPISHSGAPCSCLPPQLLVIQVPSHDTPELRSRGTIWSSACKAPLSWEQRMGESP